MAATPKHLPFNGSKPVFNLDDAIPEPKNAGVFTKVTNFVSNTASKIMEFAGLSPLLVPAIAKGFSIVGKLEKFRILSPVGRVGTSAANRINAFTEKNLGDFIPGNIPEKLRDVIPESISTKLGSVIPERVAAKFNAVSQKASEAISSGVAGSVPNFVPKASDMDAIGHVSAFKDYLNKIDKNSFISPGFHTPLNEIHKLAESKDGISLAAFAPHRDAISNLIKENEVILNKGESTALKAMLDDIGKAAKSNKVSIFSRIGNTLKAMPVLSNAANTLRAVPGSLRNSKVLPGAANLSFILFSVGSLIGVANNFRKNISTLKEMSKAITGKETSTLGVVFGKASDPIIKEARSKLFSNSVISGATDAISLGLVINDTVKGNVGFLKFMAPQAASSVLNAVVGGSTLPIYTALRDAHAAGQKISAEAYAELIGSASKELKARGGSSSVFAKELGKIYEDMQPPPSQVLRRAANGEMMKDVKALMTANEAAKTTAASSTVAAAPAAGIATGRHVAALQGKADAQPNQQPVGKFTTEELVRKAGQAPHALAGV